MKKLLLLVLCLIFAGCGQVSIEISYDDSNDSNETINDIYETVLLEDIPEYSGDPYVVLNDNMPVFSDSELTVTSYEYYSPLDELGRCGLTIASIGTDLMPTEKREDIGHIKPTGWHSIRYDFVEGKSLYNRCHLIGFQLAGENDNELNLITGTRTMNTKGMLPFENMIADYVKETGNHVAYRVVPIYDGDNLVASGVTMEGYSIEDQGEGICFNIYCFNAEPGVTIDYATGDAYSDEELEEKTFYLNTKSKKIHNEGCSHIEEINKSNYKKVKTSLKELKDEGYSTCGGCF